MPSIGKQHFNYTNKAGETMKLSADSSVNGQGLFSITLPDELEDACKLLRFDIDRPKHNLFIRGRDLEALKGQVKRAMEELMQTEAVPERVIVYSTDLKVTFWQNPDGTIASNGYMGVSREKGGEWSSTGTLNASNRSSHFSVGIYARVMDRVEYRSGNRLVKVAYEGVNTGHFNWEDGMEWAHRLNSFNGLYVSPDRMESLNRMPYTEDAAKFFHDTFVGMCTLARNIDGFFKNPEALQLAIDKQTPMLTHQSETAEAAS